MTRASLLHILDHVSEISDAEIRELEQLAAAFPYCQTAHILLAKTAHDRGSMLASQRLRRAATYAANRDLLRQLLEQPAPGGVVEVSSTGLGASSAALLTAEVAQSAAEPPLAVSVAEETPELSVQQATGFSVSQPTELTESVPTSSYTYSTDMLGTALIESTVVPEAEAVSQIIEPDASVAFKEATSDAEAVAVLEVAWEAARETTGEEFAEAVTAEPSENPNFVDSAATTEEDSAEVVEETPSEESIGAGALPSKLGLETSDEHMTHKPVFSSPQEETAVENTALTGLEPDSETVAPSEPTESPEPSLNDLLPAMAPPIRPPAEAGISRFEFELVEPALPEPSGYLLPDLEEEVTEEPILSDLLQRAAPAFHADEDLGYALGAGSRLGYDLQPHDGFTLDLPLNAFFEPDALLLAHIAAHRPKPSTSSLDLINRFLKTKPRIKTAAIDAKPVEEQADLSVRSLQAAPALASESLAKIMVKQGKIDKAIEIYERLMTRQPEKKAYFADQIQQLKQPSA